MTELEHREVRVAESGAVGIVPVDGRGSMPFALLHGESLVAIASWTLGHAGVELLDMGTSWSQVVEREAPFVVHDPLCPAVAVDLVVTAVETCLSTGSVVAAVLPGDADDGDGDGADEDVARDVVSPVVLPAAVVAQVDDWPDLDDVPAWVESLRSRWPVTFLEAPANARRVAGEDDLAGLDDREG
jgi:2-C-methyl-D-erythritol 4-phosphate cytidylyltransferase